MLGKNNLEPKGIIFELDLLLESATLLKYGDYTNIYTIKDQYAGLIQTADSTIVIMNLGAESLHLTLDEQQYICQYVLDHTLSSRVYALVLAVYQENTLETNKALQVILRQPN